jgi:hypothetical protein
MIPNFGNELRFSFNGNDRDFNFVDSLLSGSKVTRNIKDLICIQLFFTWLKVDLIDVFFRHFNNVLDFCFRKVFYLNLFCCIHSGESGSEVNLAFALYFNFWLSTSADKCHFCI